MTEDPKPRLSICVPTYNRCRMLAHSLTTLADQIRAEQLSRVVEICVRDNASTDETPAVLADLVASYPDVRWSVGRNAENIGGLRNIMAVAEAGRGDYLAITGDDDTIRPGGLRVLLDTTESGADLLLFNSLTAGSAWLNRLVWDDGTTRDFTSWPELNAVLGVFQTSFIGNVVYRADRFAASRRPDQVCNAYPHTLVAALAIQGGRARFVNRWIYDVDDSDRPWVAKQPRYTCLDMAQVQAVGLPQDVTFREKWIAYTPLVASVPRAVVNGRLGLAPRLGLTELRAAYRHSSLHRVVATTLWGLARTLPVAASTWLLQRNLGRFGKRRPVSRLGRLSRLRHSHRRPA